MVSKDLPAMLKLELASKVSQAGSPEEQGRSIFGANCSLCHGTNREGKPPAIPSLVDVGAKLSDDQIQSIVQHGQGPMPSFSQLSAGEITSLLAYLKHPELAPASAPATTAAAAGCGGSHKCALQEQLWLHVRQQRVTSHYAALDVFDSL